MPQIRSNPSRSARGPLVAVVLPGNECFQPSAAGAIALLQAQLAPHACHTRPVIFATEPKKEAAFPGIPFWPIRPLPLPIPRSARYSHALKAALAQAQPDLIEVHNRPRLAIDLARRFPGCPVSLFLHNDPIAMKDARTVEKRIRLSRVLAGVTVVSAFLRDRYTGGHEDVAAPEVQPNCLDLAALPPSLPPEQREKLILFAGRLVEEKGADRFVAACRAVLPRRPGWRAMMIGASRLRPGKDLPYARSVRAEAEAAGIMVDGYQPHAAVLAAMARAAILVVPSLWEEPFGLVALEGMACGAAVLSSNRGGLPEVTGDAAILIDPDQPEQFASALLALTSDDARRAAVSEAGRVQAAGFDASLAAARLDALRLKTIRAWGQR
ncbi:glycosyltransferase family 4 protein [Granulibacter bethesdensis]|uniref:Glycosyltransferase n=1 Tax=Granulibacter bethesdensis (strain ATCC BAA-1260 / CGDNIH1) TaxID=391165 RepID=Q0BVC7_GRABC|nr:glycosyltransferase family 4 protein [Granulibacter bethesdensis]ABI61225.1 Glycosyltransferase [Granulibacter bethesdensis CGDNIH1]APH51009.1 Glycosyltransferase [Granulibacter bethesdensis]APH63703.1 Glycosyltransferase [Granulibacter bethesdensis]